MLDWIRKRWRRLGRKGDSAKQGAKLLVTQIMIKLAFSRQTGCSRAWAARKGKAWFSHELLVVGITTDFPLDWIDELAESIYGMSPEDLARLMGLGK